ncbi:MAG: 2OG-Fe(II) oxygenase [Acidimicrobiales bacterium]|nr:2OG-Fe(II) oxygenase [Acidimicrobiales bacterium]
MFDGMPATQALDVIPVVDLRTASSGEVADVLVDASCMLIVGHGVSADLRQRMTDVSIEFFDLPTPEKERVRWDGLGVWNGWQPDGAADPDKLGATAPNLVEWYMAHELEQFDRWPARPTAMRDVWSEYYAAMAGVASRIMRLLAEAFDLPAEEVAAWTDHQFANLCVNHYPPQAVAPEPGQVRLSPHTDESAITILTAQEAPGGLEVRMRGRGRWTPVTIPPDAFLVQAADLLDRWTNRLVRASIHRVVNPERDVAATAQRDTLVYFHFPALDTVVAPAPSCVAATSSTPHYEPVVALDHVMQRQEKYAGPPDSDLDD